MAMRAGEVYEHPNERLVVRVGTAESQGRELIIDLYVKGNVSGVPPHVHPQAEEALTVITGKVEVLTPDGKWKILGPGEGMRVPPNSVHSWRPVGEDVRILGEVRPGARFEEMWRQFRGLSQDGKLGPRGDHLPFLQAMAMVHEFPDVMALAGPPVVLQHVLAAVLAWAKRMPQTWLHSRYVADVARDSHRPPVDPHRRPHDGRRAVSLMASESWS